MEFAVPGGCLRGGCEAEKAHPIQNCGNVSVATGQNFARAGHFAEDEAVDKFCESRMASESSSHASDQCAKTSLKW